MIALYSGKDKAHAIWFNLKGEYHIKDVETSYVEGEVKASLNTLSLLASEDNMITRDSNGKSYTLNYYYPDDKHCDTET